MSKTIKWCYHFDTYISGPSEGSGSFFAVPEKDDPTFDFEDQAKNWVLRNADFSIEADAMTVEYGDMFVSMRPCNPDDVALLDDEMREAVLEHNPTRPRIGGRFEWAEFWGDHE